MIKVHKFTFNPFQENTYIVYDEISREAAVVDPGCYGEEEEKRLFDYVKENSLNVKYLINTHCHIDHVLGNNFVKEKYKCDFYAPELDIPLLENVIEQGRIFGIEVTKSPLPDYYITEELNLSLGESEMNFLFTPGHTPGEYCILFETEIICLSGDVLFHQGIGRTDLWGGDYELLLNSIRSKLFTLDKNMKVFPGHGDSTTIGHEVENNPFF